ncbi:hypothetical protein PHLGIDRAFT_388912 [Phlebiopsis gigantea 11061_1 CR5-6]|uniref:Uncharacterized protein n=1 Tax=Phlebiopsis gigantea (strain 11061_1 CR5-6) TaxID=745531 RepID=A0A0C3S028_PHLG1|nr:hypothetical protein PHLGIDRAFT_388912 [Phlebiopsis gigantea 11061_1 CR5-6]
MSGSKDHPPEDENSEQGLGISLAKAMNAAISHEARPTSSHVRRGRIYSSSPESTPAHAADTFDDQERPPPPKKRKLAREIAAPNPPAKGASSAAGASSSGMKGTRGRPPGRRSLRSDNSNAIKVDEPAVAESSTSASVLVCPPTAPLPFNQNALVGELFLQLSAAQQAAGLRSYANEAQALRASVAEQIDPVARKVVELEQAFKKIEALEQSMVIKDQEQERDAAKIRQQNVLLTTRVSQLESTVERLEKQTRQQESEIQHLRDANDKAESYAIEFDKKMKEELGEATREVREKYEIVKLLIDLKKSPQAPIPTEANSMQSAPPVLMSHGTMPTMSMTAQAGVTDGAQGMLQQESPIRQYHTTYQNRRGGYIPRGRGGRPGFSTYHSPPGTHRYGHHMQGSERYDHHQDGPSPFTNAYRARGDNDGVHAATSYGGHKESRAHGHHHQEHKPYHSKPPLAEQPRDSPKYDDGSGGARRHRSRWDQGSKPEYSRAETSRGTPYERESTVSSGQTAQPSPRSRSPSKEPAISLDGSPSRGNSPMRGRSRSRKADSDSSYEP